MREDKAGLADPVGVLMSGARVGGNIGPTRGGSVPLALLEKGNEVANLDDSSLMEKRMERPSLTKDLGVLMLAFPHLKPTTTSWPARSVFRVGLPIPQTDRHRLVRTRRG